MRTANYDSIRTLLNEIDRLAGWYPSGRRLKIMERTAKIRHTLNAPRPEVPVMETKEGEVIDNTAHRINRIYNALASGRHLSQNDCMEFSIEDMRSPIARIRKRLARESTPWILRDRWIQRPGMVQIKEYWFEKK